MSEDDLDTLQWGARNIAIAANIRDKKGKPDIRKTYYRLEMGYLPADKAGRTYVSTKRRLRGIASGE